jgi:Contact-dependent growth inhibition CdiA C-terminal domain
VRTPDALVDGEPTEFKTLETQKASNETIKRVLHDSSRRGGQAQEIIIDAEGTPLTREEALRGIRRYMGQSKGSYTKIVIWGDGWTVTGP